MVGLGHRSEVGAQPAGMGRRNGERRSGTFRGKTMQHRSSSSSSYHPENRGRMPALAMVIQIAPPQFGPNLVTRHIGRDELASARPQRLTFGQNGRGQDRARMPRKGLGV